AVDYTFHMSVVRFEEHIRSQFREIVKAGVASFKVFLAYKGALNLSDEHLFAAMKFAKDLGVIVTAHCENADAIDALQKSLLAAGKTGPEWHGPSRPPIVEADGVHHLCTFAELLGTHVYIVHTSCEPAVRAALEARKRGVKVWIESVIPHFVLDETYAERAAFEGAKYVMSPPLRAKANQSVLWTGVKSRDGRASRRWSMPARPKPRSCSGSIPRRGRSSSAAMPISSSTIRIIAARFP